MHFRGKLWSRKVLILSSRDQVDAKVSKEKYFKQKDIEYYHQLRRVFGSPKLCALSMWYLEHDVAGGDVHHEHGEARGGRLVGARPAGERGINTQLRLLSCSLRLRLELSKTHF